MYKYYWQALLIEWRQRGGDSLSIPFIVGSQDFLPLPTRHGIKELIIEIAGNQVTEVYITYCLTIKDLVLSVLDDSKRQLLLNTVNLDGYPSKLFKSMFIDDIGNDIDEVINHLSDKLDNEIAMGRYSINDGVRDYFTAAEIQFIKESFQLIA